MSAFQAYVGGYEFHGQSFQWRCYATTRVYAMRRPDQTPFPPASDGRKWLWKSPSRHEPELAWLVDAWVDDFSQILVQVEAQHALRPEARPAAAEQAVLA